MYMDLTVFKPLIREFILYYYEGMDNPTGGKLHIALDDGNLRDGDLDFCQEQCEKAGDTFGYFLVTLLRHFTQEEREAMYDDNHWGMSDHKRFSAHF